MAPADADLVVGADDIGLDRDAYEPAEGGSASPHALLVETTGSSASGGREAVAPRPRPSVPGVDLIDALRTTGAVRDFTDQPVGDDVVARILDTARFAPSGGNRQGWRVVLVKDPAIRRGVRDLYLYGWHDYLAMTVAGLTPWAPVTDREAEAAALAAAGPRPSEGGGVAERRGFAEDLDTVPVMLALLADLRALAAVDRDFDRYTFAGGASVYPFAWSILLTARTEGLAGVITTMPIRREPEVLDLLGAPDHLALAGVLALGHPVRQPRRLTRAEVADFATIDHADGAPLTPPDPT